MSSNLYKVRILDHEESELHIRRPNGSVEIKNVETKSLLDSFSLEQKLISFSYISPNVVKHRKTAMAYDLALVMPGYKYEPTPGKFILMPPCICFVKTDSRFASIAKIDFYQIAGMGYRGAATEIVPYPFEIDKKLFGSSLGKDVAGQLEARFKEIASRMIEREEVRFANGKRVSLSQFMTQHDGRVTLLPEFVSTEKLGLAALFSNF